MIREKILKFVSGRVCFEATDGFTELFIRNCKESGIDLYDVSVNKNSLCAEVRYKDIDSVYSAAIKSGMTITVKKRSGLKHLYVKYRRRYGIPVGILLAVIITAVLSSVVWSVEVYGNEKIPYETLIGLLEEAGVKKGRFADSIDCDDAEYFMLNNIPELSWISIYSTGSRIFAEIREREETIPFSDKITYNNIVAAKDGEIVRADIFTGDGKIYPGTAVVKGDLLVSGVVTMRDGGVKFVNSEAVITARTRNTVSAAASTEFTAEKTSQCKDRYLLYFFGLQIPLGFGNKENSFTENRYFFDSGNIVFPIGLVRQNYYSFEASTVMLSEEEAALLAFSDFSESALALYENAEILESEIKFNFASQIYVEGKYLCVEDIAQKKQFTVEDTGENKIP